MNVLIAAMLLAVMQTSPPVPRQTADTSAGRSNGIARHSQSEKGPAKGAATAQQVPSGTESRNRSSDVQGSYNQQPVRISELPAVSVQRDWIDYISFGFSGALVLIGFFGVRYALRTLRTMEGQLQAIERQAKANEDQLTEIRTAGQQTERMIGHAEEQVGALLLNARAQINAERAWVVVTVESYEPNRFQFRATNVGKTPANITCIYSRQAKVPRGESLKIAEDYDKGDSLVSTPPRLLPPTASFIVLHCDIEDLRGVFPVAQWLEYLSHGFFEIWSYGRIIYFDTLDGESRTPHETKWMYWHVPKNGALPIPDPQRPEYNCYT